MNPRPSVRRRIKQEEIAVIRVALEKASLARAYTSFAEGLEDLQVVSRCACGCDTVEFAKHDPDEKDVLLADAIGTTPAGGTVGLIVWGTAREVTGLEVYDLGAGDGGVRLPVPESIIPWEGAGEHRGNDHVNERQSADLDRVSEAKEHDGGE